MRVLTPSVADVTADRPLGCQGKPAGVAGGERAGPRYVRDVSPADVGVRVSLRRRLHEGGLTDVLGLLEAWQDGVLQVRRRDDTLIEVPEADVVAVKRIPPAPERRR